MHTEYFQFFFSHEPYPFGNELLHFVILCKICTWTNQFWKLEWENDLYPLLFLQHKAMSMGIGDKCEDNDYN
jgi:hypothetical protein